MIVEDTCGDIGKMKRQGCHPTRNKWEMWQQYLKNPIMVLCEFNMSFCISIML